MIQQPAQDDCQLVKRIAAGDRQALTELYVRHKQPLFKYLLQLTPDHGLAEEILQDTLVAAWKSASSFEGRSTVRTWLIGIARRQAHNALRARCLPIVEESEAELAALPALDPQPEDIMLASATREKLVAAFKQLALVHREVLVLILVEELSYQEAATILEIPIGTIKSRLSNAKRVLRTLLSSREEAEQ